MNENTMTEYARAGGRESMDAELKSDLLRFIPWGRRWESRSTGSATSS